MLAAAPCWLAASAIAWLAEGPVSPVVTRPVPPTAQRFVEEREFTSPLTGEKFVATVLKARPPLGQPDYDYCPHSTFNLLAYTLVTDPATGWTNYPELFHQPALLPATKLASALGAPKFDRPTPAGLPWLDPYPWEQFENAALQSIALERPALDTANWYVQAAWAVRLDLLSGTTGYEQEVEQLLRRLPRPAANSAELIQPYELQLAAHWEQQRAAGVLQDVSPQQSALALAWVYRSRGELAAAEHWLATAAKDGPPDAGLASFLRDSLQLERTYLVTAQSWLQQGWDKGGIDDRRVGRTTFALGEIARRLGDLAAARRWYGAASRQHHGELSLGALRYVQGLAEGRGF
jgi:hypothetical protein